MRLAIEWLAIGCRNRGWRPIRRLAVRLLRLALMGRTVAWCVWWLLLVVAGSRAVRRSVL